MRLIKFRAWDGKEMQYQFRVHSEDGYITRHNIAVDWKLMQFTGLKDKNGVEIYEGDICIVHDVEKETVEIIFREETAGFEGFVKGIKTFKNPYVELSGQYYEVIGNIHEGGVE